MLLFFMKTVNNTIVITYKKYNYVESVMVILSKIKNKNRSLRLIKRP